MKARVKWVEDRTFIGESGSGHKVVLGTAFGPEGRTQGPSPMELVLIGTGGCSALRTLLSAIQSPGRHAYRPEGSWSLAPEESSSSCKWYVDETS